MGLGPQPAQVPARNYLHSSINTHNLLALVSSFCLRIQSLVISVQSILKQQIQRLKRNKQQRHFANVALHLQLAHHQPPSVHPSIHPSNISLCSNASSLLHLPNDAIDLSIAQATVKTALELSQPIIPQPTHTVWFAESLWRRQREGCGAHMPPRKEGPCSGLVEQL